MSHTEIHKIALLLQLIISWCRIIHGELIAVRPHKALMIPKEDFTPISSHAFENNVAKIVRLSSTARFADNFFQPCVARNFSNRCSVMMRSRYDHLGSAFKQFSFNYDDDSDTCTLGRIKRMSYGDERFDS